MGARGICAPPTCALTLSGNADSRLCAAKLMTTSWRVPQPETYGICFKCAKLILNILLQELLITLSACKTASARKVTAVLPVRILGRVFNGFVSHSCVALPLLQTEWYLYSSYSIPHLRLSDLQTSRIQRAARHCQRLRTVSTSRTSPIRKCAVDPVCTTR